MARKKHQKKKTARSRKKTARHVASIHKKGRKSIKKQPERTNLKATRVKRGKASITVKKDQSLAIRERLSHLLTETSVVVYASKPGGDYAATFISDNVKRLTGYSYRSFLREPSFWIDHVHPDDRERVLKEVPEIFRDRYYEYEYRFKHKNGHYIWVHDEMKLVYDDKGKPVEIVGYWTDVTKRRQMEEDIQRRLDRISNFMESATEGFVLVDSGFNVIDVNQYLLDQFGWKLEDARRTNVLDLSTDVWESGRYEKYMELLETGKPCFFDDVITPPELGEKHLNLIAFRVGEGIGLIVHDVTEQKRNEQRLLEMEEHFRSLYDSSNAGVIIHDVEGTIISVNRRACEILDLEEDELIGVDMNELCSNLVNDKGEKIEAANHPLTRTLQTATPVRNQTVGIPSSDPADRTWLLVNTEPVFDPETKKMEEVLCTFLDITEQKNIGDALEESEQRYRHIFENSPFGIGISGMDGKVITANKAMLDIIGYTLDEARAINIADIYVNVDDRRRMLQALNQYGRVTDYRIRLKRKDGTPYVALLSISRINIGGKDYYHTILQPIRSVIEK
jgi:PAS domain S-box-containing protein